MKHILLLLFLFTITSCASPLNKKSRINIVHWNIKELTSEKLHERENKQLEAVKNILDKFEYNVLSINEMQYDLPNVPTDRFKSVGANADLFAKKISKNPEDMAISFQQANTGNKAKKKEGKYLTRMTRDARELADQDSFGIFPGQYSSAILSEVPIKEEIIIKDLMWREFNPKVSFDKFRRPNGRRTPTTIELFDKTFTDVVIEVNGHDIHLISLHTVPSFHFGNKKSPNYHRNQDQLRFLEWYLTGGTDIFVKLPKKYSHIKPLGPKDKFIAVGDWNTSIYDNNLGSKVLRRLFKSVELWQKKPGHTHEAQHFGKKRTKLTLDYIAYRGLELMDAGIYYPNEKEGTCIKYKDIPKTLKSGRYKIKDDKCFNQDSVELKIASDHFPIWASFEI